MGRPTMTEVLDGRYRLIEQIARGGSSTVWRGYDERLSRPVAVKILTDPQTHWMLAEAKALALLTHPHIATVLDVGESAGRHYLVTELVNGRSLATALAGGPLAWPAAVRCGAQVASALAAVHARGVVHRDVTPANIMLTEAGAKLIDFGLSAFEGDPEADPDGRVRGTPPYAAPERLAAGRVAAAADIYGLGVVLYQALCGHVPGDGSRDLDGVAELPAAVAGACLRCLADDPDARPSAADMADLLQASVPAAAANATAGQAAASGPPMTRALPTLTRHPRVRTGWLAAAAVVVLLGVLAGVGIGAGLAARAPGAAPASAAGPACAVTYQLTADDGGTFVANVLVTTGQALPGGWRLTMHLPSGQPSGLRPTGLWRVSGSTLTSPAQTPLDLGRAAQMTLTARHSTATVLPAAFDISGRTCTASLLGPDGSPLAPGAVFAGAQQNQGGDHGHGGGTDGGDGDGHGGSGPG